ncbi:MAG: response regulator [Planctomycetes bacterium]|nr:response regulator [Planctomycetota bacterium]
MVTVNALLIEDDAADRDRIALELRADHHSEFDLIVTTSLQRGMEYLESQEFDVVLLDLSLPDAHGLEAVLRMTQAWPDLAVVVLTGLDDKQTALAALKHGAQDYLSKEWLDGALLIRSLQYAIERKRIEVQLRQSEQRYRALVAAMTSIVWSTNADGQIQDEQTAWAEYTGQSSDQCDQFGWLESIHVEDRVSVTSFWQADSAHRVEREFLLRIWNASSNRYRRCVARVVPIIVDGREVSEWVGTLTDVEDAKQAEEALRRAERLASLGTLAAGIAHEINNPIVAAWTSAEAALNILDQPEATEMLSECLQNVVQSLLRCRDTVEGVLRFARHGEVEKRNRDVAGVIRQAIQELEHYAETHEQTLMWTNEEELPPVYGNDAQMQQVLVTLMRNSIEAGRAGDRVELATSTSTDSIQVTVTDRGHGMTLEEQQRAFDPFFTSRKEHGTGLGLSIAHGIMEGHGGSITLTSEGGEGTQVTAQFPLAMQATRDCDVTTKDS